MRWVVDTSVALKWYFPETYDDVSATLLSASHELMSPDYLWIEFDNVLAKKVRLGEVELHEARRMRSVLQGLSIQLHNVIELLDHAFNIAIQTRCGVYDSAFLALAVQTDARLITADRRFFERVVDSSYRTSVTWIGDLLA